MSIILFIAAVAFLIFIHELGHFLAAKLVGIPIQEFGIGFPPKILTLFKAGGTEFTLNWLPIGGFVRPEERDDEEVPDALLAAKPIKRIIVLLAGSTMNLLTTIVILTGVYFSLGNGLAADVIITHVEMDSPADMAGLQPEDYITSVNGVEITSIDQLQNLIRNNEGSETTLTYQRGEQQNTVVLTPRDDYAADQGAMGVGLFEKLNLFQAITFSFQDLGYQVSQMTTSSMRLIGLKGIFDGFQVTREVDQTQDNFFAGYYSIMFIGSLSFSLAVINMLPVPFFDGGKIMLALPELFFNRRVPMKVYYALNVVSLGLVLILMVYVNVQDFVNPVITTITSTPTP